MFALSTTAVVCVAAVTLAACSADSGLTAVTLLQDTVVVNGNLRETASASLSALRPSVVVVLSIANQGTRPETLFTSARGACDGGIIVRAWHVVNGRNTPAWASSAMPFIPCPAHALPVVVAPGGSVGFVREVGTAEILGDSLLPDNYILTAGADVEAPSRGSEVTAAQLFIRPDFVVPPGTVLDGTWSGQADGILLRFTLHWTADSVTGAGTYVVTPPSTNRCGGATLRGTGSVRFNEGRTGSRVAGAMFFDNGWTPTYLAVLTSAASLDGHFTSIDAGLCQMPMSR